jgi:hypothetical protein
MAGASCWKSGPVGRNRRWLSVRQNCRLCEPTCRSLRAPSTCWTTPCACVVTEDYDQRYRDEAHRSLPAGQSCEKCHGPSSKHVETGGRTPGLVFDFKSMEPCSVRGLFGLPRNQCLRAKLRLAHFGPRSRGDLLHRLPHHPRRPAKRPPSAEALKRRAAGAWWSRTIACGVIRTWSICSGSPVRTRSAPKDSSASIVMIRWG